MKILITGGASRLSRGLAIALAGEHDVLLTERRDTLEAADGYRIAVANLGHDESTNELVRGVEAIVHSGEVDSETDDSVRLDAAMRCTYNLLWAAEEEGVPRVVYLGSLRVMATYAEGLTVTERWRPVPTTDVASLCHHLGEYVCREFARDSSVRVICLRLGDLVWEDGPPETATSSALYLDDAVHAVERALVAPEPPREATATKAGWSVFHIQSAVSDTRYMTGSAEELLGYSPAVRS